MNNITELALIEMAADLITTLKNRVEVLEGKVGVAAAIFEEYARLHSKKLTDSTPTDEWLAINQKIERNKQYAADMRAALKPDEQAGDRATWELILDEHKNKIGVSV